MTFSSDLNRIIKKTNGKFDRLFRYVTIEALSSVVRLSPVDTGRFRGNWQVSANQPKSGVKDSSDRSGAITIGLGSSAANKLQAGQTSYVVNNLPYANRLENGWSQQAPQGMVKRTAKRLKRNIQNEAKRLNKK